MKIYSLALYHVQTALMVIDKLKISAWRTKMLVPIGPSAKFLPSRVPQPQYHQVCSGLQAVITGARGVNMPKILPNNYRCEYGLPCSSCRSSQHRIILHHWMVDPLIPKTMGFFLHLHEIVLLHPLVAGYLMLVINIHSKMITK